MIKISSLKKVDSKEKVTKVTASDIEKHLRSKAPVSPDKNPKGSNPFPFRLVYILSAVTLLVVMVFFVISVWSHLSSIDHVVLTLGVGLLFVGIGSIFLKQKPNERVDTGTILHALGGVLVPLGILVTLYELDIDPSSHWISVISFGLLFSLYIILGYTHRRTVLHFFTITNGTAFVYLLTEALTQGLERGNLYVYINMLIGAGYLALALYKRKDWNEKLIGILYLFGSLGIFGFALLLASYSFVWEIIYIFVVTAGYYLSYTIKSLVMLAVSTVAFVAYLALLANNYLAEQYGWPVLVVGLGIVALVLGVVGVLVGKRYRQENR